MLFLTCFAGKFLVFLLFACKWWRIVIYPAINRFFFPLVSVWLLFVQVEGKSLIATEVEVVNHTRRCERIITLIRFIWFKFLRRRLVKLWSFNRDSGHPLPQMFRSCFKFVLMRLNGYIWQVVCFQSFNFTLFAYSQFRYLDLSFLELKPELLDLLLELADLILAVDHWQDFFFIRRLIVRMRKCIANWIGWANSSHLNLFSI